MFYENTKKDLEGLYENGWDASFEYKGMDCLIFPRSSDNIQVIIGPTDYIVTSFEELINLEIDGQTLLEILENTEVQYY